MFRNRSIFIATALTLLVAILLAACSAGQPESPATAPETSVAETGSDEGHEEGEAEHDEAEGEHTDDEDEHAEEGEDAEHEHFEVPSAYEGLMNPVANNPDAIATGADLYATTCASCHGDKGMGDGSAGAAFDPKPTSFADAAMLADMSDGYIFWRITEGGSMEPFNSTMPPWGSTLSEDQLWQLVSYLRTLPLE